MNNGGASISSANAALPQPKPIRFVTNSDGPYAKRRRINSACLTCRKKKTRCSGERPVCGTCISHKHECAGYGPDSDNTTPAEATKETKKVVHREAVDNVNVSPHRPKVESAMHHASSPSHTSDSSANARISRHETGTSSGLSLITRNRMPYFRYFGPTAIMPGFKQMVVKVKGKQHSTGQTTSEVIESSPGVPPSVGSPPPTESGTPAELPVYDTSTVAPSPLITHLCKLFFVHLGCSFPFLQRERFLRDLEEKEVDAILVDAVCALAARFSTHPLLIGTSEIQRDGEVDAAKAVPSEYGQAFAQRAKSAIPDAFPCPSVAVVQAAVLLAYDEFGASRDSGVWMYLGIAIRMAQDLGMHTLQGLKYEGRDGPTPRSVKTDPNAGSTAVQQIREPPRWKSSAPAEEDQRAVERERLDTFWAIFFLDRVISSGTGRPVTLRDKDIEICFPSIDDVDPVSGYPLPFPALIRIIHLYGRVTDLLNSIKEKTDITDHLKKQLDNLEYHLTEIYQGLSPKLHFNALNFQHYVKINQGTNFLLLHCWFHTLIVLLHQPTLLKAFEGSNQHLSNNSRELSMSSAKTVADILSFTELIDLKTGVGNPFTSQPIYIAACAFLNETTLHSASSQPPSRLSTPDSVHVNHPGESEKPSIDHFSFDKPPQALNGSRPGHADHDQKQTHKHTLLASAANQNYQRCYRALKSLHTYWAGIKYILTVLDQKAKGVVDPLLYTREEMESALEVPASEPSFTVPGWRRKLSWGTYLTAENLDAEQAAKVPTVMRKGARTPTVPGSPLPLPTQAIGWSLTGTMNSPSTNVAVMYTADNSNVRENKSTIETSQPSIASVLSDPQSNVPIKIESISASTSSAAPFPLSHLSPPVFDSSTMPPPPLNYSAVPAPEPVLVSDADLLLNLHSPYSASSPDTSARPPPQNSAALPSYPRDASIPAPNGSVQPQNFSPTAFGPFPTPSDVFGDMVIDSQDIDMSALGADMMPWDLEYLPYDFMFYGDGFGEGAS